MGSDLRLRLLPFAALSTSAWLAAGRPRWSGLSRGRLGVQLAFGLGGGAVLFGAGAALQLLLIRRRGSLRVPASGADLALQTGYYALNAPLEEAFFRGLLQGGLGALLSPPVGFGVATTAYVLYHRLGRWPWTDVLATALAGVPLGLAFWRLPGPPSLLGVGLAHFGATCGFLGAGPWLLHRLGLL
jgi:membrane protease YdiL (CAAX protease family)